MSFVEWKSSLPIEIELIVEVLDDGRQDAESIEFLTPPGMAASPVFCRVVRVNSNTTIYTSGLQARRPGEGADQVADVFDQLAAVLKQAGSDFKHLAKATYYVADEDCSTKLNSLRPKFYDPKRPPAASKAMVAGLGTKDRGIALDMIAVPVKK